MRIDRLVIRGFGTLRKREFEFPPDRVAIIAEPNESGKTALIQAIIAALYGLPKQKAGKTTLPLKTIYEPWDGDAFGVEAVVSVNEGRVHLIHDFRNSRFQAQNLDTGRDITLNLGAEPARQWLGIGRDDFGRIAFISGKEQAALAESDEIVARLEEVLSGSEKGVDAPRRAIEAALQKCPDYSGKLVQLKTAIGRAREDLAELRARRDEILQEQSRRADDLAELETLHARLPGLSQAVSDAESGAGRARLAEVAERLESHASAESEVRELEAEAAGLAEFDGFPLEDEQQAANLAASTSETGRRLAELTRERETLEAGVAEAEASLAAHGRLGEVTPDHLREMQGIGTLAGDTERRHSDAATGLAACESALSQSGVDRQRAALLLAAFEESASGPSQRLAAWMDHEAASAAEQERDEKERAELQAAMRSLGPPSSTLWGLAAFVAAVAGGLAAASYYPAAAAVALLVLVVAGKALYQSRSVRSLVARLAALNARRKDELARAEELRASAQQEAVALGLGELEQACQARRDWLAGRSLLLKWRDLGKAVETAAADMLGLRQRAGEIAAQYGRAFNPSSPLAGQAAQFVRLASEAAEARDSLDSLKLRLGDAESALKEVAERQSRQSREFAQILAKGGVSGERAPAEALQEFTGRAAKARRLAVINGDLLPRARVRLESSGNPAALGEERRRLEAQMGGAVDESALPLAEAAEQLERRRKELDEAEARAQQLSLGLWETLTRNRTELPAFEDNIGALEEHLARAERFQSAAQVAMDVLEQVGSEARKLWSGLLKDTVSGLLSSLGLRWNQALFQDDLAFSLYDSKRGAWLKPVEISSHLSTGAKDQVWLCCRIGICRELSREEALPMLLDDPFLTWDDERFRRGMRLAAGDLAEGNQIILVTCQEQRHRLLVEEDPEWFASRFSIIDL